MTTKTLSAGCHTHGFPVATEALLSKLAAMVDPARLRWAPPVQVNPTIVNVPAGFYAGTFGPDQDVTFVMPATARFSSFICDGGRHVRVIGGSTVKTTPGQAFTFLNVTGSVFIEGQYVDLSAVSTNAFAACGTIQPGPYSTFPDVYIQNCHVTGVRGSFSAVHAQAYIPEGSIASLYIDKLTAYSDYQGLFIPPTAPITAVEIHRTDLGYLPGGDGHTFLLWLLDEVDAAPHPTLLDDVWVTPHAGADLSSAVWPNPAALDPDGRPIGSRTSDGWRSAHWHPSAAVSGIVRAGPHPEFVPASSVGLGYVSPGYY